MAILREAAKVGGGMVGAAALYEMGTETKEAIQSLMDDRPYEFHWSLPYEDWGTYMGLFFAAFGARVWAHHHRKSIL